MQIIRKCLHHHRPHLFRHQPKKEQKAKHLSCTRRVTKLSEKDTHFSERHALYDGPDAQKRSAANCSVDLHLTKHVYAMLHAARVFNCKDQWIVFPPRPFMSNAHQIKCFGGELNAVVRVYVEWKQGKSGKLE
jgi:hypothetical protein